MDIPTRQVTTRMGRHLRQHQWRWQLLLHDPRRQVGVIDGRAPNPRPGLWKAGQGEPSWGSSSSRRSSGSNWAESSSANP
jgi:hypothetical protein